jgi:RNA polymerase sigma factor (sigma-70 family)
VADDAEISDGDLARLARDGDPVAFRLLVERHQPMARARARASCANPSDVDDIVQDSFLRAFIALDRLRDPDRFAAWLAGIVVNICHALRRRDQLTLLSDWPEPLHPAAADGLPSADDLDRADALRAAIADLPEGQRRAVALHYYADLPAGQIGDRAGAARVSLHKARRRLRAYLAEHRPDLAPAVSRRPQMTAVRIARAEHHARVGSGPGPNRLVVLADDAGSRELPLWLLAFDGDRLVRLFGRGREEAGEPRARTVDELIRRLLRTIGATVTGVDIDELGPEVTAARIGLTGPAGARQVTARLADGLALAITTGAPIRVADAAMDRLAVPAGTALSRRPGVREPAPSRPARPRNPKPPRYEPCNLDFADGLDRWLFNGSFTKHASESHWYDYICSAERGIAVISSAAPEPAGFAVLQQLVFADDYHGGTTVFRGEFRFLADGPGRAGLFLRVKRVWRPATRGPVTEQAAFADPDNTITLVTSADEWTGHQVTVCIPAACGLIAFGMFLAAPGRIEMRNSELIRHA